MSMARYQKAIAFALQKHLGQVWPGTSIPYVAHAFEVACRVAAGGGSEEAVLAAFLHDVAHNPDTEAVLHEIRSTFGERVASVLRIAWADRLLPHGEWESWIPEPDAVDDEDLRFLVTCDALCTFRNILLDWEVLAHGWDDPPPEDTSDLAWARGQFPYALTRHPWTLDRLRERFFDPSPAAKARAGLLSAYQGWMRLPLGTLEPIAEYPSLVLPYVREAWGRWVEYAGMVPHMKAWGFRREARELEHILWNLEFLVNAAQAGFVRTAVRRLGTLPEAAVVECLRRMPILELMWVLAGRHSRVVHGFRRQLPRPLLEALPVSEAWSVMDPLAEPILLHWLTRVAHAGGVGLSPVPISLAPPEHPRPLSERYSRALDLILASHADEAWPDTQIPYFLHPLECSSLALTSGWGEEEAILALLHDLPRTHNQIQSLQEDFGVGCTELLRTLWSMLGPVHRAVDEFIPTLALRSVEPALLAVAQADATSLLRWVSMDLSVLVESDRLGADPSRRELREKHRFFRLMKTWATSREAARYAAVELRFGAQLEDWHQALTLGSHSRPDGRIVPDLGGAELLLLWLGLFIPPSEATNPLEAMDGVEMERILTRVDLTDVAAAFSHPDWAKEWNVLRDRLDPGRRLLIQTEMDLGDAASPEACRLAQELILAEIQREKRHKFDLCTP